MAKRLSLDCPDCSNEPNSFGRRDFLRVLGASATALAIGAVIPPGSPLSPLALARAARLKKQAEAESLVFDLFKSMGADQRKQLVLPWDTAARLGTHNAPVGKSVVGEQYDKKQVELLHTIFKSLCNGDEGYERLSRKKGFDGSGSFESIGAVIYGEPVEGQKFSLMFAGHHITLRCDGDSEESTAFGGPLYYGHSPNGYSAKNVFQYQTKMVGEIFGSLNVDQKKIGVLPRQVGRWGRLGETPREGRQARGCGLQHPEQRPARTDANGDERIGLPVSQRRRRRGDGDHQGQRWLREVELGLLPRRTTDRERAVDVLAARRLRLELPDTPARPHVREHQLETRVSFTSGSPRETVGWHRAS